MKLTVRQPVIASNGIVLKEVPLESIDVQNYAVLTIDGSTDNSGLAIMREYDGALMYCISAKREDKKENVSGDVTPW